MFRKSNIAAVLVTAGLASAALASPASALPIDQFTLDTGTFQYGANGSCAAGLPPGGPGDLNWRENLNQTTIAPYLDGDLCLQGTNAQVRMAVDYHDVNHNVVTRFASNPATGNGSPLNAFAVATGGPRVAVASVNHVIVRIERNVGGGNWNSVASSYQAYP